MTGTWTIRSSRRALVSLLGFFLGFFGPTPARALTVEQLLMDLNDEAKLQADLMVGPNRFTRIREESEATTIDSSFTIVGGGALVLCERGHFQAQGVCDSSEGISDVVGFVAGQAELTLFSDFDDGTGLAVLGLDLSNETRSASSVRPSDSSRKDFSSTSAVPMARSARWLISARPATWRSTSFGRARGSTRSSFTATLPSPERSFCLSQV